MQQMTFWVNTCKTNTFIYIHIGQNDHVHEPHTTYRQLPNIAYDKQPNKENCSNKLDNDDRYMFILQASDRTLVVLDMLLCKNDGDFKIMSSNDFTIIWQY